MFVRNIASLMVSVAIAGFVLFTQRPEEITTQQRDFEQLTQENYQLVYLPMYSEEYASEYPFEHYMGWDTYKAEHEITDLDELYDYVKIILTEQEDLVQVFGLVDPEKMIRDLLYSDLMAEESRKAALKECILSRPDIEFVFLLPSYSLEYWKELDDERIREVLDSYLCFYNEFNQYENVRMYFFGDNDWLIANPGNYTDAKNCTQDMLNRMIALSIYNDDFLLAGDGFGGCLDVLYQRIMQEKYYPKQEFELADYDIVFLGDSIIGNYSGPLSIPGVVSGLSGATTYNCAIGGQTASMPADGVGIGFGQTLSFVLGESTEDFNGTEDFHAETERFCSEVHNGKKLCFVLNYGINDYYLGRVVSSEEDRDIYTYKGALKDGILRLQAAYPEAEVILMTPNFVQLFDFGRDRMSEEGDILNVYADAAVSLAEELGIACIDNYRELGLDENNWNQYLEDGTHLNERGRYEYAGVLMEYLMKK